MTIRNITVVGAGTMGRGIAHVSALAGYDTVLTDVSDDLLGRARELIRGNLQKGVEKGRVEQAAAEEALARLRTTEDLEGSAREADLVIEAVPEDENLKREIFSQIDVFTGAETIYGSNTSSLSITRLAGSVERRDRFIGIHFFNPVHVMRLVEIVVGERTSEQTVREVREYVERIGKVPIVVKDSPGFATSRLGLAIGLEAMRMFEENVGSAEDIDRAMELGYNHPMGPLRLTDLVGLDVRLSIAEYLQSTLGPRFEPPAILRRMVSEGRLGQKSGEGFYRWDD